MPKPRFVLSSQELLSRSNTQADGSGISLRHDAYSNSEETLRSSEDSWRPIPPLKDRAPTLGKPTAKPRLEWSDLLTVASSLTALALAILVVANRYIAWRLSYSAQIQVLGVLLSIMNLCLTTLASRIFLLLEVRFGRSSLSNFEGILRNQALLNRLDGIWRVVILSMLVVGPGLDVIPKAGFLNGGSSSVRLDRKAVNETTWDHWSMKATLGHGEYGVGKYGLFGPAGVHQLGGNTGLSLFTNATLPYLNASNFVTDLSFVNSMFNGLSTVLGGLTDELREPAVQSWPFAYGFNMLVLNNESTAMLDTPNPDYLTAIRSSLAIGDSWNMTASVVGTLATYSGLASDDPTFKDFCKTAATWRQDLDGSQGSLLLAESSQGSGTIYFGYTNSSSFQSTALHCLDMAPLGAWRYNLTRQPCTGIWTVTRGGSQLMSGSCSPTRSPSSDIFHYSGQNYTKFYPVQLEESLSPYATVREGSHWRQPSTNTMIAAMAWSRLTSLYSAADNVQSGNAQSADARTGSIANATRLGLLYDAEEDVISTRPAIVRSWTLYFTLCAQPFLTLLIFIGILAMHKTPVSKGFGLISILAGVEPESLELLHGASLSGELSEDVYLLIRAAGDEAKMQYVLRPKVQRAPSGKLMSSTTYS